MTEKYTDRMSNVNIFFSLSLVYKIFHSSFIFMINVTHSMCKSMFNLQTLYLNPILRRFTYIYIIVRYIHVYYRLLLTVFMIMIMMMICMRRPLLNFLLHLPLSP